MESAESYPAKPVRTNTIRIGRNRIFGTGSLVIAWHPVGHQNKKGEAVDQNLFRPAESRGE